MDINWVTAWLKHYVKKEINLNLIFGGLVLIGSIIILALTWSIFYSICYSIITRFNVTQPWISPIYASIMILLLFWGNARTSREYLSTYKFVTGTASDEVVAFGANINPIAPETIHSYAKIVATILFIGPGLMVASFRMFRKAGRLFRLDISSCAAVIALLERTNRKMAFREIVDSIKGLDPTKVFPQLHEIDGVLFLDKEPAGLVLSEDLKAELRKLL